MGLSALTDSVSSWMTHTMYPMDGKDVGSKTEQEDFEDFLLKKALNESGGSRLPVRWQAPELNDPQVDHPVLESKESDIYAWSCVCYEVCSQLYDVI